MSDRAMFLHGGCPFKVQDRDDLPESLRGYRGQNGVFDFDVHRDPFGLFAAGADISGGTPGVSVGRTIVARIPLELRYLEAIDLPDEAMKQEEGRSGLVG